MSGGFMVSTFKGGPPPTKPHKPVVGDGGGSADQVMEQLRQMEEKIDELRARKRESTPPEKRVGESATPSLDL